MKAIRIGTALAFAVIAGQAAGQSCTVGSAPITSTDFYPAVKGSTLTIGAGSGVLGNDKVCNVQSGSYVPALTYAGISVAVAMGASPAHGTVQLNPADGSFVYTPNAGFTGVDTFSYLLNDGNTVGAMGAAGQVGTKAVSGATLVTIGVTGPNSVPTLSEWAMIVLASATVATGALAARRRRSS